MQIKGFRASYFKICHVFESMSSGVTEQCSSMAKDVCGVLALGSTRKERHNGHADLQNTSPSVLCLASLFVCLFA